MRLKSFAVIESLLIGEKQPDILTICEMVGLIQMIKTIGRF